ncbi:hypothetical protein P7K49_005805 [Saguinus oedipus]|uniref:Uncharacterized protein n=1 Tax=Saguinus oedipus TaxID=9490 RepID=A0ABQ9W298_SAGOE|nr:hypothetical protein P7K49_005805 [Saguinus oedipus]
MPGTPEEGRAKSGHSCPGSPGPSCRDPGTGAALGLTWMCPAGPAGQSALCGQDHQRVKATDIGGLGVPVYPEAPALTWPLLPGYWKNFIGALALSSTPSRNSAPARGRERPVSGPCALLAGAGWFLLSGVPCTETKGGLDSDTLAGTVA